MNNVIIKLYRNEITSPDFHDINLDKFEKKIKELKKFAKDIGKNVSFSVCENLDCANFDSFAEITYDDELTEKEKTFYVTLIKFFNRDAEINDEGFMEQNLPVKIFFIKSQMETVLA